MNIALPVIPNWSLAVSLCQARPTMIDRSRIITRPLTPSNSA